ncbi:hypothetical protein ACFL6U_27545 [Planctomycetota bacterium]
MKPEKKIETLIKKIHLDTHPVADDKVFTDMLMARQRTRSTGARGDGYFSAALCLGKAVGAAALILLALSIGFAVGRRPTPSSPQIEQMRLALEDSLKHSLTADLRATLLTEIGSLLAESTDQTLAVSEAWTNQRLLDLLKLMEAARAKDRQHVAAALEKLQTERLQDKSLFKRSLTTFAAQTHDLIEQRDMDAKGS